MMSDFFIETLKVVDGHFQDASLHFQRMIATLKECRGGMRGATCPFPDDELIPADRRTGIVKCRYVYNEREYWIEFEKYVPRKIRSLKLVDGGDIDYHVKYADRRALLALKALRGDCDDVLIVKGNELTDTSYSNIVLFGGGCYVTPRSCLLNGIKRQSLIRTGRVVEERLTPADLRHFERLYIVNSMLDIEDGISVTIADVV